MLKVSAFYVEKQKSFIPKTRCQYQNKKALFIDSIFQKVLVQVSRPYEVKGLTYIPAKIWEGRGNCFPCTPGSDGPVFDYDEIICDYTMQ